MIIRYSAGERILFSLIVGIPKTDVTGILVFKYDSFCVYVLPGRKRTLKKNVL